MPWHKNGRTCSVAKIIRTFPVKRDKKILLLNFSIHIKILKDNNRLKISWDLTEDRAKRYFSETKHSCESEWRVLPKHDFHVRRILSRESKTNTCLVTAVQFKQDLDLVSSRQWNDKGGCPVLTKGREVVLSWQKSSAITQHEIMQRPPI